MKKLEILVLSVLSAAFLLAGCSGNDSPFPKRAMMQMPQKLRKSLLMSVTEKLLFRCLRTIKSILPTLKTRRNITTFQFPMARCSP